MPKEIKQDKSSSSKKVDRNIDSNHRYKAALAISAMIAIIIFAIALVVIILNKDDSSDTSINSDNRASLQDELQGASVNDEETVKRLSDEVVGQDIDSSAKSVETLREIANNVRTDKVTRQLALDAIADSCHLSFNLVCLQDLKSDYEDLGADATLINFQIDELVNLSENADDIDASEGL